MYKKIMQKLTVITVVKNNVRGIEKTIKSVLNQTQKKIEHIVIDGMSNDGTSKIISKYKTKLKHIREPDNGIYSAINKGLKIAKGEFIAILHSGDVYYNEFSLEKAINFMEINNLNASSYNMVYKKKESIVRYWKLPIKKITSYNCFKIAHPTLIVKKELFSNLKYDEENLISNDYRFLLQLTASKKLRYKYNDCILQLNEYGGISTSTKFIIKKLKEDIKIIINHFNIFYIYLLFYKLFSKINSFFIKPEKYDILFINFYFADKNGFGDDRHLNFFKYLSLFKSKILILGCCQNHFQKSKTYINKYFNNKTNVESVNSLNYKNTFTRTLSILFFNFKLLLNFNKFKNCKKIFLTAPDYLSIIIAYFFSKILDKKLIVEFRDVYPENIEPYFKNKFFYWIIFTLIKKIESIAIKNSRFIVSNLPYFYKCLDKKHKKYKNKLYILPNLSSFDGFNKDKKFVYAGKLSKINNNQAISNFFEKLDSSSVESSKFLTNSNTSKIVTYTNLTKVLKKFGFGVFSFKNSKSLRYGLNHKKLNLYFDNGVLPVFLGDKKISKYFFSHFPIIFVTSNKKNFKHTLNDIFKNRKSVLSKRDKIKKNINQVNSNSLDKLKHIFMYN
ncbi:glycosyltransferase [Pelagibacteraceae bacterium]|nr:glycosyltransferase [Pelagibacteraceae bacterium]